MQQGIEESQATTASLSNGMTLFEIWTLTKKRKWVMLFVLLVFVASSVVYVIFEPPVYKASAMIQIGYFDQIGVDGVAYIEIPDEFIKTFPKKTNEIEEANEVEIALSNEKRGPKALVTMNAVGSDPELLKRFLDQAVKTVKESHDNKLNSILDIRKQRLDELNSEKASINKQINLYDNLINSLISSNPQQASVLAVQKGNAVINLSEVNQNIFVLGQSISSANAMPTRVIQKPFKPIAPIKPKKTMIVLISAFLGLLFGVILVVFLEFSFNPGFQQKRYKVNSTA